MNKNTKWFVSIVALLAVVITGGFWVTGRLLVNEEISQRSQDNDDGEVKEANIQLLAGTEFIQKYSQSPGGVLLDVRTPDEYNSGYIPGALNIDYSNTNFVESINKLDKSKLYFVYCRSGNRSAKAVKTMQENGFNQIIELKGGIVENSTLVPGNSEPVL